MAGDYDPWSDIFPPEPGRPVAPVGVGMDVVTGRMLMGWPHVLQSMAKLFKTRFHDRILRQWVGSFVPHLIGENTTETTITRFYWALITSIELWEPRYKVLTVRLRSNMSTVSDVGDEVQNFSTSTDMIRRGEIIVNTVGTYVPRAHLGDFTPESRRRIGIIGRGGNIWDVR